MEDLVDDVLGGGLPQEEADLGAARLAAGEAQPLVAEAPEHLLAGTKFREAGEDQGEGALHLQVGILDHPAIVEADQARGQMLSKLPTLDLALPPGRQAQLEQVQLGFAEHAT